MADDTLDLASLLCSRLCHDLMSPVGALANGLELLADETDPDMRRRCFDLLEQSARISAAKLRFFRVAFGASANSGETVSLAEMRALVDGLAGNTQRVTVAWAVAADALPKPAAKTLLNFALIGLDALVRGGTLDIGAEASAPDRDRAGCEIVVRASGPRIAFDPDIARALAGEIEEAALTSRTAPAAMIHRMAAMCGGRVQVATGPEALLLGAELPDLVGPADLAGVPDAGEPG